jgi:hypothetical protein
MAIISYTGVDDLVKQKCSYVTWVLPTSGDTGQPLEACFFSDKTVQAFGTAVTSITMQGSNDPRVISDPNNAVWFTLADSQGNDITKTAAFGEVILENPRYVRPNLTTGTAVTVILCLTAA